MKFPLQHLVCELLWHLPSLHIGHFATKCFSTCIIVGHWLYYDIIIIGETFGTQGSDWSNERVKIIATTSWENSFEKSAVCQLLTEMYRLMRLTKVKHLEPPLIPWLALYYLKGYHNGDIHRPLYSAIDLLLFSLLCRRVCRDGQIITWLTTWSLC